MTIHLMLCIVLALLANGRDTGAGILIGVIFGLVTCFVNFDDMTAVFSWIAKARNCVPIASNVMFGAVRGAVHPSRARDSVHPAHVD
ncbi:hypothetical protein ACFFGH_08895 [Lysobacter korlensis]|uniref:Uncharacterized protein n=1 Tax=Lysobacter korlensis TaxID=553636 RepID=A0ABV6RMD7_9GAMM